MLSRRQLGVLISSVFAILLLGATIGLGGCSDDASVAADLGPLADAARDLGPQADRGPGSDAAAGDGRADLAPDSGASADLGPFPALGQLTMVINLGDSIAAGQGVAKSYADLLMDNDDAAYPAFVGKDLSTKYPTLQLADLAVGGATSVGLVNQAKKAPANPQGNTLVVLSIGGNDIMNNFMALLDPAQTKQVAQTVAANIQGALANFEDKTRYPGKVFIVALNVYEMTDGQGTFPADEPLDIFCSQLRTIGPVFGKTLITNHGVYNDALEAAYAQAGVYVVDLRQAFLGHGFNYKDATNAFYDVNDPTLWLQYDCIHPNVAGHQAIRRLLWQSLFGS